MFCARCGKQIDDDSTFCPFCGQQVDAPVTGTKFNIPFKEGISTQAKKWMIGAVAGLVAITGVTVGAVRLIGGSDDKEPVVAEVEESEPVAEAPAEAPASTEAPAEEPVSEEPVDGLYTVSRYEISNIASNFFKSHLGCYVDWALGNCRTEPVDISSMLEHTKIVGAIILDDSMQVVSDYNDKLFNLKIRSTIQNIGSATARGKGQATYASTAHLLDINMSDSFSYYQGTEAVIGAIFKLSYTVNDEAIYMDNNYAVCSFVNNTNNPKTWLLYSVVLMTEDDYNKANGDFFTGILVDENLDPSKLESDEWKQKYLLEFSNNSPFGIQLEDLTSYLLKDINGDGIPEFWYYADSPICCGLMYIRGDGTAEILYGVGVYSGNKLRCVNVAGKRGFDDEIYEWDSNLSEYKSLVTGYWETEYWEDFEYSLNGTKCSEEEYNLAFDSLLSYENASSFDAEAVSVLDKPVMDAISEY